MRQKKALMSTYLQYTQIIVHIDINVYTSFVNGAYSEALSSQTFSGPHEEK